VQLRTYQTEAVSAAMNVLAAGRHPFLSLPTGSGKSLVIAELVRRLLLEGKRVLIPTHVQELVEGNAAEFERLTGIAPGVLCAGLARADKDRDVLFASVQSLYSPAKKGELSAFDVIIVDEGHMVADKTREAKFYPAVFKAFPDALRVGLSATPYRLTGEVYGEKAYFSELAYEVGVLELVEAGFLAPLVGVNTALRLNRAELKTVAGEFEMKAVELQEDREWLVKVVESVLRLAPQRAHIAVFCPGVDTAKLAAELFRESGVRAGFVVGDTDDRDGLLGAWKSGEIRVMCSVNVLTTGFNFPALDCIVCLRPTQSKGLWVQMLGRGTRVCAGKANCLVLDYAGNLLAHGGIAAGLETAYDESPVPGGTPMKVTSAPRPELVAGLKRVQQVSELTALDPMFAGAAGADALVRDVSYVCIPSTKIRGKRLLMVSYECERKGVLFSAKQFVCNEYEGYALLQAAGWFARRGCLDFPRTAERARLMCYGLPTPRRVQVRRVGKWLNVIKEEF
jgi:DNA repair protein RadD